MDKSTIDGVTITPLKEITNQLGSIFHGVRVGDSGFVGFGEAYFSEVIFNNIKGWTRHKIITMNLICVVGSITVVLYDERINSTTHGKYYQVVLSRSNYKRLTVPPGIWCSFRGNSTGRNVLFNLTNYIHNPEEMEKKEISKIAFNWNRK